MFAIITCRVWKHTTPYLLTRLQNAFSRKGECVFLSILDEILQQGSDVPRCYDVVVADGVGQEVSRLRHRSGSEPLAVSIPSAIKCRDRSPETLKSVTGPPFMKPLTPTPIPDSKWVSNS